MRSFNGIALDNGIDLGMQKNLVFVVAFGSHLRLMRMRFTYEFFPMLRTTPRLS